MNGLYLQLHAYMLRVAVPYGSLNPVQMRALADIARRFDRGYGHFTTRTNIQFNWPALQDLPAILSDLAEKIAPKFARDEAWLTWLEGARKRLKTAEETAARKGSRGGRLNAEEAALLSSLAGGGPPSRAQEMEDIQKTVREELRRKAAEKGDRGERLDAEEAALLAALEGGGSSPPARACWRG
jgi:hypothetical protein